MYRGNNESKEFPQALTFMHTHYEFALRTKLAKLVRKFMSGRCVKSSS